jgi:hypothetical protein
MSDPYRPDRRPQPSHQFPAPQHRNRDPITVVRARRVSFDTQPLLDGLGALLACVTWAGLAALLVAAAVGLIR